MLTYIRTFLNRPGLGPQLIKASIGSTGLNLANMFFGFLVGVQLARGLGAEGYGVYGTAMSIVALLSVIAEFGLPQLLIREVAAAQVQNKWGLIQGALKWASKITTVFSLIVFSSCIAWFLLSHQQPSSFSNTLLLGTLLIPLVSQTKLKAATLRGLQHIVKSQLPESLIRPASFSLFVFLFCMASPLSPAIAISLGALSGALSLFAAGRMLQKNLPPIAQSASIEYKIKEWRTSALPLALSEAMRVTPSHLTLLLIGSISTFDAAGVFRVASSTGVLIGFPVSMLTIVSAPIIARLFAQSDSNRLQNLLSKLSLAMTVATLALSLPFIFFGPELLDLTFGKEFESAQQPLLILCLGNLLNAALGTNSVLLNMTGHHAHVMRASAFSLVALFILSPILITEMGATGAAIAVTIASLLSNAVLWRDSVRLNGLDASILSMLRRRT